MTETYYERLGVSQNADQSAIQQAWQQAVKETHPDQNDDPDAQQQFIQLKEAHDVLSDPEERKRYDQLGHEQYLGDRRHGSTDTGDAYERDRSARQETNQGQNAEQARAEDGTAGNVNWDAHTRGHEAAEHVWKDGSGPTANTAPPTDTADAGFLRRLLAYGGLVLIPGFLSLYILPVWIGSSSEPGPVAGNPFGLQGGVLSESIAFTVAVLAVTFMIIAGAEVLLNTNRRIWKPFW
ncbi:J domain-containing protein [Halovenus amylolytica]|uniref:J domain-containing protein n=1 Tax=Halovenus amylolytica TaxID=2500550 RepID=UPI00361AEB04